MGYGDSTTKLFTKYCGSEADPIARGRCGGYVEQCVKQKVEGGKDPNSATFELTAAGGKVTPNMDYYECLQMSKLHTAYGKPAGYEESLQPEINRYESLSGKLQQEITKLEPYSTKKYSIAMNKALGCMPSLEKLDQDDAYCVAKNKYEMLLGLKKMLEEETQTEYKCKEKRSHSVFPPRRKGKKRHKGRFERVEPKKKGRTRLGGRFVHAESHREEMTCKHWPIGKSHPAKEVMEFAMKFCSSRCMKK